MASSPHSESEVSEKDLRQWDLLAHFRQALKRYHRKKLHRSWSDPRRQVQYDDYLCLYLFGLLNPALKSMRGLCAASRWERVQQEVCGAALSLGSFSEAQHLTDPAGLEELFGALVAQVQGPPATEVRQAWQQWFARDSSLFAALPRMSWALYGGGRAGGANNAVRLHLNFHLLDDKPAEVQITRGKSCERKVWKESWRAGAAYVGDRYFGENYALFGQLELKGCRFVLRLREEAVINVQEEIELSQEDRKAGLQRQAWATLGVRSRSVRLRVLWIALAEGGCLRLVTNVGPQDLQGWEVGLLYRRRWQIECFFRWLKCLLGCRHWLAESQTGVSVQLYLALIAAVLFQLYTGRRPNKRMMELYQMYQLGWASLEELLVGFEREQQREAHRKTKTG